MHNRLLLTAFCVIPLALGAQQQPTFRARVDLVAVDVQVVDRDGRPITTLTPNDFDVFLDGHKRPVVSASLRDYTSTSSTVRAEAPAPISTQILQPSLKAPDQRLFLLAVDETSFGVSSAQAVMQSATRFLKKLEPTDLVGLASYPVGGKQVPFTTQHSAVQNGIAFVAGRRDASFGQYHLSPSEIVDIFALDREVFARVVERECGAVPAQGCREAIRAEARAAAGYYEGLAAQSLSALRGMLEQLRSVEGRKTLVIVSGGLLQSDRSSGRPDNVSLMLNVGEWAAMANTGLYVLHFDTSFLDTFSAARRGPVVVESMTRDRAVMGLGLERIVDKAGGGLIRIEAGTADYALDRVLRETAAYYLLGVTPDDADRDGKPHYLRVNVKGRGLTVRSRKQVLIPRR